MAFYKFSFLWAYIDYRVNKEYKQYMGFFIINNKLKCDYDAIYNEVLGDKYEKLIEAGEYYDDERIKEFDNVQFPGKVSEIVLNNERMDMLREIKSIFVAQKTDYRIVISPIYDQVKINPEDLQFLIDLFGQNNVYDFSGPNQWNADFHNY